jgi:hypothetical protein
MTGDPDATAAHLFAALQSRPGHAVVVADDAATAEAFFEPVDAQLVCQRRVRLAGRGLEPESMIAALGADIRGPHRPRSEEAILSLLATEARTSGLPILVIIAGAEEAGTATLERLATLIDSVPDARAAVRLVLLGSPRLEEVLAQPEAQTLATRVLTTVRAPSRGVALPLPAARGASPWRGTAQWVAGAGVIVAGVIMLLTPWAGIDRQAPTPIEASDSVPAAATEPPASPEPPADVAPPVAAVPLTAAEPAVPEQGAVIGQPAETDVPRLPPAGSRPRRPSSIGQSLQVGAFRNAENARALAGALSARFPDVRIVTITRDGILFHCVRLGGFADEYALAARADTLRAAGYPVMRARE